jgi:FtsH-binding integral membrane protein
LRTQADWAVVAGLPPIAFGLEAIFTWLFRLEVSVFFHGIRWGVYAGWGMAAAALALLQFATQASQRPLHPLDRALISGLACGLGLGCSLASLTLGVALIPMTVFTLLVGIGLFGLVPFFVASVLVVRARELSAARPPLADPQGLPWLAAFALGIALAWSVPVAVGIWTAA